MSSHHSKPSFAKVAASISKEDASNKGLTPGPKTQKEPHPNPAPNVALVADGGSKQRAGAMFTPQSDNVVVESSKTSPNVDKVADSLGSLGLSRIPTEIIGGPERPQVLSRESAASDESQRADSSSELGTKPPSLDGKSITSGTTFALDEKESLRPDDSASVKAAAEDDDSCSIRGSFITGSRMGSELAARARGIQLGDMPDRRLIQITPGSSGHGILTPQSTSSEQQPRNEAAIAPLVAAEGSADALNLIYRHAPDEKLIEAMGTPKDRMYLLRLEKDVIDFVQNSKEPYMDLPPSNSFCRMLAHKLADYYHMTHSFEPNIGVVRIFRTPFCRVPTSLVNFDPVPNPSNSSTPPPVILPKKIMRRGQEGEAGQVSSGPSKPASEDGSDAKDNKERTQTNPKLTREEREEMYKLARERIFGSADDNPTGDVDKENDASRASSVSGNNRSNSGKGRRGVRHRRDDSDGFDSRHHYAPYWGPQQQAWAPQYGQPSQAPVAPQSAAYVGQMPGGYVQQNAGYPAVSGAVHNPAYPQYQTPSYPPPATQQRFPSNGSPMASYGSPVSASQQQSGWQQGFNSPSYPSRTTAPSTPHMHPGIPYAFGQLPAHANPHDPKSQHPIPGSYNRNHSFNPMTQSFVPGGNGMPPPGPQPPFTAPTSHHSSPQIGSTHPAYTGYQQGVPQPYGGGHGMVRQGSNNSVPGYHPPPQMTTQYGHRPPLPPHPSAQSLPQAPLQHVNPNQSAHIPPRPTGPPQGPNHVFSHLPTYGNPATLPQKPATGI